MFSKSKLRWIILGGWRSCLKAALNRWPGVVTMESGVRVGRHSSLD